MSDVGCRMETENAPPYLRWTWRLCRCLLDGREGREEVTDRWANRGERQSNVECRSEERASKVAHMLLTFSSTASVLNDLTFEEGRERIAVVLARGGRTHAMTGDCPPTTGRGRVVEEAPTSSYRDGGSRKKHLASRQSFVPVKLYQVPVRIESCMFMTVHQNTARYSTSYCECIILRWKGLMRRPKLRFDL